MVKLHAYALVEQSAEDQLKDQLLAELQKQTPRPLVVLAGDGIRCDLPVAPMGRAETTGSLPPTSYSIYMVWPAMISGRYPCVLGIRWRLGCATCLSHRLATRPQPCGYFPRYSSTLSSLSAVRSSPSFALSTMSTR